MRLQCVVAKIVMRWTVMDDVFSLLAQADQLTEEQIAGELLP